LVPEALGGPRNLIVLPTQVISHITQQGCKAGFFIEIEEIPLVKLLPKPVYIFAKKGF